MRLLAMSGFIPEQICDLVRFTGYAGDRNLAHYCGYASDYISQVLRDDTIDGAVFPRSCDSSRIMSAYLKESGKFMHQIRIPSGKGIAALDYFASEIHAFKIEVEKYFKAGAEDITERIERINARNRELRDVYENIGYISFADYLKSVHEMLRRPLSEQKVPVSYVPRKPTRRRIFLSGSFLANVGIVEEIEKNGMTIVGDTLTESGRMLSAPDINPQGDLFRNIAAGIMGSRMSPTQNDFQSILNRDMEEIKRKDVKGVIFITQKYCESYDYLFTVYKKTLDAAGIPVLQITLSDSAEEGKSGLCIGAFSDIL